MAFMEMRREVVNETYIAIGTRSQRMTVDPNFTALINAIELNDYVSTAQCRG
jgi:hypothetical protein